MRTTMIALAAAAALLAPSAALASRDALHGTLLNTTTSSTSSNWSGYAAVSGKFTSVSASWVQPYALCAGSQTAASFWVGIDGDGSQTVEQTGTYSNCNAQGVPQYYAWFELYPNPSYKWTYPVSPGDKMSASVTRDRFGRFKLTISDATQHWTGSTTQSSSTAQLVSAEVIAEAPSYVSGGIAPLTNFGTVSFTSAKVNGATLDDTFTLDKIDMASGGTTKAVTGALSNGAFAVTWQHS